MLRKNHRACAGSKSSKSVVRLYKSFVRPILKYASFIWNPYTKTYRDRIERAQKSMFSMVPDTQHLSHRDQLEVLCLLSLEARGVSYQLISLF